MDRGWVGDPLEMFFQKRKPFHHFIIISIHFFLDQPNYFINFRGGETAGCFLKWWYPQNTPKMIIFSRKTHGCWVPPFKETPSYQ